MKKDVPGRHRLRPTGTAFPKQHGCPAPPGHQHAGAKVLREPLHLLLQKKPMEMSADTSDRALVPGVPRGERRVSLPRSRRHFRSRRCFLTPPLPLCSDTSQVVLCIQRSCFHNATVAGGTGGEVRRSVWWKSNQESRSGRSDLGLNEEEGSAAPSFLHGKRAAGRLLSGCEKAGN